MTDVPTLLAQAEARLKQTKVGYVNKFWTTPPAGSAWSDGLALIEQAKAAVPTPTPTPAPTPPPPTVARKPLLCVRYSGNEQPQTDLPQYGTVLLAPWLTTNYAYVRAQSPGVRLLVYKDPSVATKGTPQASITWNSPVSFEEASAHDAANPLDKWLVYDSTGAPTFDKNYPSDYIVNMASASYQALALTRLRATYTAQTPHWNGGFLDNMNPGRVGAADFLASVGAPLRSEGFYMVGNCGVSGDNDGTLTCAWWDKIAPNLDGLNEEYWQVAPDGTLFTNKAGDWRGNFDKWLAIADHAQSAGRAFYGMAQGAATDTTRIVYGLAAFLLKWNGTDGGFAYRSAPLSSAWTRDIGTPTAPAGNVSGGWLRPYSKGVVVLNPNPAGGSPVTFNLPGTFTAPDGSRVTSVTLAPTSAMILEA